MSILTAVNGKIETADTVPYAWGYEDAVNGDDAQGSSYFMFEDLDHYNAGYAAGLAKRKQDATAPVVLDEIAFFEQALVSLRNGTVKPFAVSSDVDPLAAEEWIGNAISSAPYLW